MQYNTLLTRIAADIYSNGAELITGDLLQNVLNDMVGALASAGACYKGTITPASAAPLDLDQPTVYLALEAGTYTNFVDSNNDPIVTTGPALITYDGGASLVFSKTDLPSGSPDAVLYTTQILNDFQKARARSNIGAASAEDLPWRAEIGADEYSNFIAIKLTDGDGCILAVDSVGDNSFHGVLNISSVGDITAASFVGAGGIDTDEDVEIGDDGDGDRFVVLGFTTDQPVVITCLAGTAPVDANSVSTNPIESESDTLPWTELGAGGGSDVFVAEYGVTTYQQVIDAHNAGKIVIVVVGGQYVESLAQIQAGSLTFSTQIGTYLYRATLSSSNVWSNNNYENELAQNKVSTISGNETNTAKYPNTKAVADALGKWGVISQTQTWTQAADGGYDYTIDPASIVRGIIPQANIDLFTAAGATFNTGTGYFELNGLVDISYEEMMEVYAIRPTVMAAMNAINTYPPSLQNYPTCPRTIPSLYRITSATSGYNFFRINATGGQQTALERVSISHMAFTSFEQMFYGCRYLKSVEGVLERSGTAGNFNLAFTNCVSLESVSISNVNANLSLQVSSRLTAASVAYMINNSNTSAATITITLHATAYARANADADVQAALAAHTNVSLASA